jgi:hypothetical protein
MVQQWGRSVHFHPTLNEVSKDAAKTPIDEHLSGQGNHNKAYDCVSAVTISGCLHFVVKRHYHFSHLKRVAPVNTFSTSNSNGRDPDWDRGYRHAEASNGSD